MSWVSISFETYMVCLIIVVEPKFYFLGWPLSIIGKRINFSTLPLNFFATNKQIYQNDIIIVLKTRNEANFSFKIKYISLWYSMNSNQTVQNYYK